MIPMRISPNHNPNYCHHFACQNKHSGHELFQEEWEKMLEILSPSWPSC